MSGPTLYFDLETQRSAQEVGGWSHDSLQKMGISVAVVWDSGLKDFKVYLKHQWEALVAHLKTAGLIVGFNHLKFDYAVLSGHGDTEISRKFLYHELCQLPNFDMLAEITKTLGHRLRLDQLAVPTLRVKKSAEGLMAIEWYREGKMKEIIDYCKQDVAITRDLFLHAQSEGELLYESRGGVRSVTVDWSPKQEVQPVQMALF